MTTLLTPEALAAKLCALEKEIGLRADNAERAVLVAETSLTRRLDAIDRANYLTRKDADLEFGKLRDTIGDLITALKDQTSKMITRLEYTSAHEKIRDHLSLLTQAKDRMEGKASQLSFYVATAIATFSLILGAIHIFRDVAR